MSESPNKPAVTPSEWKNHPFRRAVLRGLGVVLPPLLTIVIFLWVWSTIQNYVLEPVEVLACKVITWYNDPIRDEIPAGADVQADKTTGRTVSFEVNGIEYIPVAGDQYIPRWIYRAVTKNPGTVMPTTAEAIYHRFLRITYLRRTLVVPMFLSVFILLLYFLGRFLAAGVGRFLWNLFEQGIQRVPIIRNVYGSVKQVTDFVFSEQDIEYTRVVAVEYPRKGIWSLGFVTGESMLDIRSAANEAVLSVLIPTSPMPATGFTVTIRKSETIDLNMTVDQAFQFIVSCGVVIPAGQEQHKLAQEISTAVANQLAADGQDGDGSASGLARPRRAASRALMREEGTTNGSAQPISFREPAEDSSSD